MIRKQMAIGALLVVCAIAVSGCATESTDTFATTGTVIFISLEGGFFGIKGDDGQSYDPVNLPDDFKKDGLRIRFEARVLTDMASFHMWGKIIDIRHVEKL